MPGQTAKKGLDGKGVGCLKPFIIVRLVFLFCVIERNVLLKDDTAQSAARIRKKGRRRHVPCLVCQFKYHDVGLNRQSTLSPCPGILESFRSEPGNNELIFGVSCFELEADNFFRSYIWVEMRYFLKQPACDVGRK